MAYKARCRYVDTSGASDDSDLFAERVSYVTGSNQRRLVRDRIVTVTHAAPCANGVSADRMQNC